MRVVILGGAGAFGSRLAQLIHDDPGVSLVLAGRSLDRARAAAGPLGAEAAVLDRDKDLGQALAALRPDVLVDASGPFQAYGGRPYRVAEATLAARAHYLDLADDAAFVAGIGALDAEARGRGLVALSGLSTLPALSFAAARMLAAGLDRFDSLEIGVAPSPKAPLGLSVVAATASYAGAPVRLRREGRDVTAPGLVEARRLTIAPPGVPPLSPRLFLLADAPDLRLAALAWPGLQSVWVGAGPAPQAPLHLLRALAWLRSRRLLPPLTPLAPLFHRVINALRWGEDRGGMIVQARGLQAGRPARCAWMLVAEGADGPFIPAMAAAAILRRLSAGPSPTPGARPATHELELDDFAPFFAARAIRTGVTRAPG
ncbi:saccharopine dehydrogenase family protein [Caulobacter sp. KR2-114]|uniref:saccharopine dehydrogenase family protein n=1 Tax=Caulobacter sp. KR2-114 TaxID=3400912 RepID=UPI003BFF4573